MKRLLLIAAGCAALLTPIKAQDELPEPSQRSDAPYRLFRTKNMYTFLRLDTRTGMIWHVQWGTEDSKRFVYPLFGTPLADGKKSGRFTLVPTRNIYTFLLLDQEDGRVWWVQWNTEKSQRLVLPIEDEEAVAARYAPK